MKTIWKFELVINDFQEIEIPKNADILTVQIQDKLEIIPCIWALVNPENKKQRVKIRTFGTGHPIEENFNGKYIGTYQIGKDSLVFHVFIDS